MTTMTQNTLFNPPDAKETPFNPPGAIVLEGDHYNAACQTCGAAKSTPADVGRLTAECTLRYAGWRRGKDRRWRCGRCVAAGAGTQTESEDA
jgi:hypothetical protein